MNGRWLGAMPVDTFLQRYLPGFEDKPLEMPQDPFKDVPPNGLETDRCDKFITAIGGWIPHLHAINTSYNEEDSDDDRDDDDLDEDPKPNISIYNRVKGVAPPDQSDFSRMELWIEFKKDTYGPAFRDPRDGEGRKTFKEKESFTPPNCAAISTRERLAHMAGSQHSVQLRHFSFSVLVEGDQARFFRWDPSATVVTAAFDYREDPYLMAEFLWGFDNLSAENRGHDTSVQPAHLSDEVAARVRKQLKIEHTNVPLYRFDMPGTLSGQGHLFGPWLSAENLSLVTRSSRNSPVVWIPTNEDAGGDGRTCEESETSNQGETKTVQPGPWSKERLVYLKDTWRYVSDEEEVTMAEHEIYDVLYRHKTPNIPEDVTGGDVLGGTTELVDSGADWLCVTPRVSQYQHYRLLHGTVGRPMRRFESTKQLVSGVFDALQAHSHAFNHAKLLHRDISIGNIIFTDDNKGLLIDWELAIFTGEGSSTHSCRTGTWSFMSAGLLMHPQKENTFTDDLESFLHLLARTMLEYIPARPHYQPLNRDFDLAMFDEQRGRAGDSNDADSFMWCLGGYRKRNALRGGYYPSKKFEPQAPTPLTGLLVVLSSPFKSLYVRRPPTAEDRNKVDVTGDCPDQQLSNTVRRYDKDMERLRSSTWFIDTIKDALDKPGWPTNEFETEAPFDPLPLPVSYQAEIRTSQVPPSQIASEKPKALTDSKRPVSSTWETSSAKRHCGTRTASGAGK